MYGNASHYLCDINSQVELRQHFSTLLGKFDADIDQIIERIMQEIANAECMGILLQRGVKIEGWVRNNVLLSMLKADTWHSEFNGVLSLIDASFSETWEGFTCLLYALARYKADQIGIDELLQLLPQQLENVTQLNYGQLELIKRGQLELIKKEVEAIRVKAKDSQKRKIAQIASLLNEVNMTKGE